MKRDQDLLLLRNFTIEYRYNEMTNEGLKHETVVNRLSLEFFLAPRTIQGILSGEYDKRKNHD